MGIDSAKISELYRRVMCRRPFYKINKALYFLSLKGMGIGNWQTQEISGERDFLGRVAAFYDRPLVIDVGANVGNYSNLIRKLNPNAVIYAFEPHPETYKDLAAAGLANRYATFNIACGNRAGRAKLFDHKAEPGQRGTEHASLVQNVIEDIHNAESISFDVDVVTLDEFVERESIERIKLLKIDVEGNERQVLEGAGQTIDRKAIDFVHFEFTETSMLSRVFMKDFFQILGDYEFYRMLPDGLAPMGPYFPPIYEIFAYQNIVAVRRGVQSWL